MQFLSDDDYQLNNTVRTLEGTTLFGCYITIHVQPYDEGMPNLVLLYARYFQGERS